jgi:hypothetical protein
MFCSEYPVLLFCSVYCLFCFIVLFCVLSVCNVLCYCHRVSTQLQLTKHTVSYTALLVPQLSALFNWSLPLTLPKVTGNRTTAMGHIPKGQISSPDSNNCHPVRKVIFLFNFIFSLIHQFTNNSTLYRLKV